MFIYKKEILFTIVIIKSKYKEINMNFYSKAASLARMFFIVISATAANFEPIAPWSVNSGFVAL